MALTFVDLFCGIGTIRMGMEQAGHRCVYSVEWDKHKRKIYSIIFGKEPEGADIREVHANDIPRSDVWTFGAPCQDFSIAGKREGMEGERSSLVLEVFRLVRETPEEDRPKYLIYENVKGMLSSNGGRDFLEILNQMATLGYDRIEYSLLNSKNFGVPQNRERVFTVGHLRGRGTGKIFPLIGDNGEVATKLKELTQGTSDALRVYDPTGLGRTLKAEGGGWGAKMGLYAIGNIYKNEGCQAGRVYDTKGISPCLCPSSVKGSAEMPKILEPMACLTPDRLEKRQNGRRFKEPGEPMFTLTKQDIHGVMLGYRIRKLTPKECWRLQGIPDEITDKVIQAGISDSQMYRGSGDACTVNVIYEIAKKLT